MSEVELNAWVTGACHCGKVRFQIRLHSFEALACNCSVCAKKGFINLITKPEDFELLTGEDELETYRFNTRVAEHKFCRHCGVHPFSRPRSHPGSYDVNARCLDGGFDFLTITPFDGQNWEDNVASIRDQAQEPATVSASLRSDKLSPHFTLGEMIRSETAERQGIDNMPPAEVIPKLQHLCTTLLEPIREHFARPFRPNSGYRSEALNRAIGGSPTSQHCRGEAVDIEIHGVSNFELAAWIRDNLDFDQVILECYRPGEPNSGWGHVSLKEVSEDNRAIALTYHNRTYSEGLIA